LSTKKQTLERLSGGSIFKELSKAMLESFSIPRPPLPEQQKIAEILSMVDQAIQKTNEIIAKTERLKKGLMQELLTGRVRVRIEKGQVRFYRETRFKDSEIGKVPEDWEVVKLGDILCGMKRGFSYRSSDISTTKTPIRFITINDYAKEGGMKTNAEKIYLKENMQIKKDYFVSKGDLFIANTDMSKGFIIGAPLLVENIEAGEKVVYSMDLTKLIIRKRDFSDNRYLFWLLRWKRYRKIMKSLAQGTNVLHLNQDLAKLVSLPRPPLPEQQKIAEILSMVDKKLELEKKEKERLERIKKGLMDVLLTGKVRVKVDE